MSTFRIGGIHPQENKQFSEHKPIVDCPLPQLATVLLAQQIGAPAVAIVEKGQKVKVGELIAKANGFVSANVHSPVSGTVTKLDAIVDSVGFRTPAIIIQVEGDEWMPDIDRTTTIESNLDMEPMTIVDKIQAAGIVGLGGACFPTHVKLLPPPGKKADVLIVNGVECEPFLTNDHQLMLEHGREIIIGIKLVMKAIGVKKAIIGIEKNKPDAIRHLQSLCTQEDGIEVRALTIKYPQGGEKQLIDACIHRQVPSGALPIEVGAVVDNVATLYAIYEAIEKNKPLIDRIMTVTGKHLSKPGNYRVRFGTPISDLIDFVGGVPEDTGRVIAGGPMMGRAMSNWSAMPANKRLSALLFIPDSESHRHQPVNCIRCGKCISACPMGLEPYLLATLSEMQNWDEMERHDVMDCIDCGSCLYTCPSQRPLLDFIRLGKGKVGGNIRVRQAAAKAAAEAKAKEQEAKQNSQTEEKK